MEYNNLILRYGELFLKGENQWTFVQALVRNVKALLGPREVKILRGRLVLPYFSGHAWLKRIFGITSYSPALRVGKDLEEIKKAALVAFSGLKGTFRVESKRSDKSFPVQSPQINQQLGQFIEKELSLEFARDSKQVLYIEVNQDGAYLYTEVVPCLGGLPTGVEGKVMLLLEDTASLLAGVFMMKRGCSLVVVGLKEQDISLLQKYSPFKMEFNLLKDYSAIEDLARVKKIDILGSGQRFEKYSKIESCLTVFRPLVAYSEEEVKGEMERLK